MDNYENQLIEASDALANNDYDKALAILQPLIDKSVAGAFSMLGVMHQLGTGAEYNGIKAVGFLTKAVELGDGVASHNLGTIYAMGMPGVPQDFEKSRFCYHRARNMGCQFFPDSFYE